MVARPSSKRKYRRFEMTFQMRNENRYIFLIMHNEKEVSACTAESETRARRRRAVSPPSPPPPRANTPKHTHHIYLRSHFQPNAYHHHRQVVSYPLPNQGIDGVAPCTPSTANAKRIMPHAKGTITVATITSMLPVVRA